MAKKKARGTPRRTKKKPAPKKRRATSTALVRREPAPVTATLVDDRTIGDGIQLGELGLVELRLTEEEEAILAAPPPIDRIRILPTGQVYAPHPEYTRLFNRAFGRLGWAIAPVGKPALAEKTVVCPYILFIHGKPVAFAQGEQEYFASNKGQSYGDALESTVASALRRCSKRLGVWLELWDRAWGEAFVEAHGVKVWCEFETNEGKKNKPQWRLRTDPPFWNEKSGTRRASGDRRDPEPDPPAGFNAEADQPITLAQRERLLRIAQKAQRTDTEIRMWLRMRFGIDSSKELKRRDYDFVCKALEHPGELPGVREG